MLKFGLSTRLYLFGGPEELRPAEGLSKLQRRQLAALEVIIRLHSYSLCLCVCLYICLSVHLNVC